MKRFALALLATTLVACAGGDENNLVSSSNNNTNSSNSTMNSGMGCQDLDGDGFDGRGAGCPNGRDCDDAAAQSNPAQSEVCGDQKDNNCDGQSDEGCEAECIDNDNDRHGQGAGCFGTDCDDSNPMKNASGTEICGNGIDEDCSGADLECATNCNDADGDGYGDENSTDCKDDDGNVLTEVDCFDDDPKSYPGAEEICDEKDNDCDGEEDECPQAGQSCDAPGGQCIGGAGTECENHDDCAGDQLRCDPSQSPKVCRAAEGGPCTDTEDCVEGLTCGADDKCTGDFCAADLCTNAPYDVCDGDQGLCVECPHFNPDEDARNDACEIEYQECVEGGWCAFPDTIFVDGGSGIDLDIDTNEEFYWINWYIADCWLNTRPNGIKKMCSAFIVPSDAFPITEDNAHDAYDDGQLDNQLTGDENSALDDVWGIGLFDRKEIDWKTNPMVGTDRVYCLWYQPGGGLSGETLVLDRCDNFSP